MKELFTKNFWKDVQKTYEEAQKEVVPEPKLVESPAVDQAAPTEETATSRHETV